MAFQAYIGIGSNLGDRLQLCRQAIEALRAADRVVRVSPCYETDPLPGTEGGPFLNGVVEIETGRSPTLFLRRLQEIEASLGRVREKHWGARTIDLDLLLYGQEVFQMPELTLPHPELPNRRFVLKPLADLAPDLIHPVLSKTVQELLDKCPKQGEVISYGNFY